MNFKKTMVLALVLSGLFAYIFWVEVPHQEEQASKDVIFRSISKSEIESIEIDRKGEKFTLKNAKPLKAEPTAETAGADDATLNAWHLADAKYSELDRATLNSLVTSIVELKSGFVLPKDELEGDLGVYGLGAPALALKVRGAGKELSVSYGKENEFLHMRYAKISGFSAEAENAKEASDVFLVTGGLYAAADKAKSDFRNKSPLNFVDSDLKQITLNAGGMALKFESDNGTWHIIEPHKYLASTAAVGDLLKETKNLRATEFLELESTKLKSYGFDKPVTKLNFDFKPDKNIQALEVKIAKRKEDKNGKKEDVFYLNVSNKTAIFKLGSDPTAHFVKALSAWREKQLFHFALEDVQSGKFSKSDGSEITLTKSGEGWNVNGKNGDNIFVRELLNSLSILPAHSFPDKAVDFGFSKPRLKMVLNLSPQIEKVLVIGNEVKSTTSKKADKAKIVKPGSDEKLYYAGVGDLSETFIIDQQTLNRITPKEEVLIKIAPITTPAVNAAPVNPS